MKTRTIFTLTAGYWLLTTAVYAASTISTNNSMAYGANIGWMDWRGDETNGCVSCTNGVVVGEFVVSGYIYAANVGWIYLGNGSPANGIQYQNNSASDFGVNNLGTGELRGFAYGANIGWIVFTNRSAAGLLLSTETPRYNLATGVFSGYAYGANVGWISLSNTFAYVKTGSVRAGADSDGDTIADAWELQYAPNLTVLGGVGHDQDGDGKTDRDEYLADTNPVDQSDYLRVTAYTANSAGSTSVVTWTSELTRCYALDTRTNLLSGAWANTTLDAGTGVIGPDPGSTTTRTDNQPAAAQRFYRVRAFKPLTP